jgi:RNA polymerase sigma factor (sigma-70 family)
MSEDLTLLTNYATTGSEQAFSALVSRHINLVYSVALRRTGDPQLAEDVAQKVFSLLATKARGLPVETILPAWLSRAARNFSSEFVRAERRRASREKDAMTQSIHERCPEPAWAEVAPLLDEALEQLSPTDHDAIVLRFLDAKPLKDVGAALGTTEDAARMRVNRALETLRTFFQARGVTISLAALAASLAANASQAAPSTLTGTTVTSALLAAKASTAIVTAKAVSITILQLTAVALVAAVVGLAVYSSRQASTARTVAAELRGERAELARQLADLQTRHSQLSNQLTASLEQSSTKESNQQELLRLRGEIAVLRSRPVSPATTNPPPPAAPAMPSQPGSLHFANAEVSQVLNIYTNLAGLNLVIDSRVPVGRAGIQLMADLPNREEAMKAIEKSLFDQAGIVIVRIDNETASVTYNDAFRKSKQRVAAP